MEHNLTPAQIENLWSVFSTDPNFPYSIHAINRALDMFKEEITEENHSEMNGMVSYYNSVAKGIFKKGTNDIAKNWDSSITPDERFYFMGIHQAFTKTLVSKMYEQLPLKEVFGDFVKAKARVVKKQQSEI